MLFQQILGFRILILKQELQKKHPGGVPWGHTIVIKGRLHQKGQPDNGIQGKEIWIHSADGPAPYPEETRTKIAVTKKDGKFVAFM